MNTIAQASGKTVSHLESLVSEVERSPNYRVLRRVGLRQPMEPPAGACVYTALVVDIETTGIDIDTGEIIQITLLPLTYGSDGRVFKIGSAVTQVQQPSQPMAPEVMEITGITNEDVADARINAEDVAAMVCAADIIVAHHADFVRPVLERALPIFRERPWGCTLKQIPWMREGHHLTQLPVLAWGVGLFMTEQDHQADCHTVAELLASRLPKSGVPALRRLLDAIEAGSN